MLLRLSQFQYKRIDDFLGEFQLPDHFNIDSCAANSMYITIPQIYQHLNLNRDLTAPQRWEIQTSKLRSGLHSKSLDLSHLQFAPTGGRGRRRGGGGGAHACASALRFCCLSSPG